jgi:glycosyltransferase involved in cell wall biosynthesis
MAFSTSSHDITNHMPRWKYRNSYSLIVGHLPPPRGGVSVYLERLIRARTKNNEHLAVLDLGKTSKLRGLTLLIAHLICKPSSIEVHEFSVKLFILLALSPLAARVVVFEHNWRELPQSLHLRRILSYCMKRFKALRVAGEHILDYYMKMGIELPQQATAFVPFVEPDITEYENIIREYPEDYFGFIETHRPIVAAVAFSLSEDPNLDIYGIGLTIEALRLLKPKYKNIGLVLALSTQTNNVLDSYLEKASKQGVLDSIYVLKTDLDFWPALLNCDVFLRPTLTDGDSVSVREAIFLGVPVLASDCVERPPGTYTFRTGDLHSFVEVINGLISSRYGKGL